MLGLDFSWGAWDTRLTHLYQNYFDYNWHYRYLSLILLGHSTAWWCSSSAEEKPLTGQELAEASQSDKVWKESWSSSLSLSDLTLMDCFVVQGAGQVLSYITIYGVFAQQVPFPSLP